jgi:hypothetical protein
VAQAGLVRARHRIHVLSAEGRPADGAVVTVVRSSVPFPEIALVADESGTVELHLPPGRFTFRAQGRGGAQGQAEVESPGAEESVVRLGR